jgi:hypothetical protein
VSLKCGAQNCGCLEGSSDFPLSSKVRLTSADLGAPDGVPRYAKLLEGRQKEATVV